MRSIKTTVISALVICALLVIEAKAHPGWGIVVDNAGQIYFADVDRNKIWRINRQGKLEAIIAGKHSHEITLDKAGNLYGTHLYYVEAGNHWFTGFWKLLDRDCVRRVTLDGVVTTIGAKPLAGIERRQRGQMLSGLTVDARGNVYAADGEFACLRRIKPDNKVDTVLASGWFWSPSGVTSAESELYVLERVRQSAFAMPAALGVGPYIRVRKLTPDGTATTIATVWGEMTLPVAAVLLATIALVAFWMRRRRRRAKSGAA